MHSIHEAIVQYALMKPSHRLDLLQEDWLVENWKFYRTAAVDEISTRDEEVVDFEKLQIITACTRKERFDSMHSSRSVSSLSADTLYITTKHNHNGALYDCMFVDHSRKQVFIFQVVTSELLKPDQHRLLDISTVRTVMEKLNVREDGYKMVFICCCSSSVTTAVRKESDVKDKKRAKTKTTKHTAAFMKEDNNIKDIAPFFAMYIAKIKFLPCDQQVV